MSNYIQYCVYIIQNTITNKIYIGYSSNFEERMKTHFRSYQKDKSEHCNLLYNDIKKYNWNNFTKQIIEVFDTIEEASEGEMFWIEFFQTDTTRFGTDHGYNESSGGLSDTFIKRHKECLSRSALPIFKTIQIQNEIKKIQNRKTGFRKNFQRHNKLQKMRAKGYL